MKLHRSKSSMPGSPTTQPMTEDDIVSPVPHCQLGSYDINKMDHHLIQRSENTFLKVGFFFAGGEGLNSAPYAC
jgi:hypothetical protein